MKLILSDNVQAIELHYKEEKNLDLLINSNDFDFSKLEFVSIHAHAFIFDDNEKSHNLLEKYKQIVSKYKVKNIVVHADNVKNWEVLNKYKSLPISIENLDSLKNYGKTFEDMAKIFNKYEFGFTFDLQHCFTNDPTMKLAKKMHSEFKSRLVEYHISGFEEKYLHYPLFKTYQNEIIKSMQRRDVPIIIESAFQNLGEHITELNYITKKLAEYEN